MMNIDTLDKKIKARAAELADKDIAAFKTKVRDAIHGLVKGMAYQPNGVACLRAFQSTDGKTGWPKVIWETHEAQVRADVLATMDALQLMMASPGGGEHTSDEGTETNG